MPECFQRDRLSLLSASFDEICQNGGGQARKELTGGNLDITRVFEPIHQGSSTIVSPYFGNFECRVDLKLGSGIVSDIDFHDDIWRRIRVRIDFVPFQ